MAPETVPVSVPESTDVLVVGAGPAGSAAAAWAARAGLDVVLADAETFPRDKACGDGLTPRAIAELNRLGLDDWVRAQGTNRGLRAAGFGQELLLPWPGGSLPGNGGAVARLELDARIREVALDAGALPFEGARAVDVERDGDRVAGVVFRLADGTTGTVRCSRLVVADGARSTLGRVLGREWHRDTAYGVAARGYIRSGRSDDPWISSHLELRGTEDEVLAGYGWVFPLNNGEVNIGVGTLATEKRPAGIRLRGLIEHYAAARRDDWELDGRVRTHASALLPMGGAVSGVAGANWALIGDAAGCVNPLNGEGIDYGLETGRLVAELMAQDRDLAVAWPATLRTHYGQAFSIARRIAGIFTVPHLLPLAGPIGMRSRGLMTVALRVMGNLVTDADTDLVARAWRAAGKLSLRFDARPPFPAADLRRPREEQLV
jgi:geranylgeranyl reductase family protein